MKINEIIEQQQVNEGPLDFAKKIAAGIGNIGSAGGFRAGYATKRGEIERAQDLKSNVRFAMGDWGKIKQSLLATKSAITPDDVVDWANNYFAGSYIPGPYVAGRDNDNNPNRSSFEIIGKPTGVENKDVADWLTKQWQHNYAKAATQRPTPPVPPLGLPIQNAMPAAGSVVDTNLGKFEVDSTGKKWIEQLSGADAPAEYTEKLNQMWADSIRIKPDVLFPVKDIPSLPTTNAGEFRFLTRTGGTGLWYKVGVPPARDTIITDPNIIKQLNQISKDMGLGQS